MIDEDLNTPKNIGKGLLMCAFLASASMGMQQVQASETDLSTPTLDALHNAGTTMPGTTDIYPESGYTLTETTDKTLDNVITKYEVKPVTRYYDMTTGAEVAPEARVAGTTYKEIQEKDLVPHYYQVNLKQTEYGTGTNSSTITVKVPTDDVTITAKYDTSKNRFDNTTDNSATDYTGDYINQTNNTIYTNKYNQKYVGGGAIYNNGTDAKLGTITGNFIGNHASFYGGAYGGAIYNSGTIRDITGNFISNYIYAYMTGGGAIYNSGKIVRIKGDFMQNKATTSGVANGGAIYNESGTIGDIDGNFINNYATNGGAISNSYTIGNITGNFIGNYATAPYSNGSVYGGAISNYHGTIGDITGDFIGNYAKSTKSGSASGGAIYEDNGTIGNITGDFIGNYASSIYSNATGGAIFNSGTIGNITGDFIGNYTSSTPSSANGGAIYNYSGTIGNITGDFINNYATTSSSYAGVDGGAIYNFDTIGNITGDFINNYATTSSSYAGVYGGAISNSGTIGNITGDFIGNYASSTSSWTYGGAIYNFDTIGDITGDFIDNYASGKSNAQGGAIYNFNTIGDITGDFIGNYAKSTTSGSASGGAIYNYYGTIGDITGNFIGNYASYTSGSASGGAISNYYNATIGNITGDFIGNYATGKYAYGGAIYNPGKITNGITGDFIGNYASSTSGGGSGGAIYNHYNAKIGDITGDFTNNYASSTYSNAQGGAIYNSGKIVGIKGDFMQNKATSESGIANGGAIYNDSGTIGDIDGNFINNYATTNGGAIYLNGGTVNLKADNTTHYISGNKTSTEDNAVYGNTGSNLNMKATNNGKWVVNDNFNGIEGYNVNLLGDSTGTMNFNNKITNANLTNTDVTTNITSDNLNHNNSLTVNSGTVNVYNMGLNNVQFRDLQFAGGDTNLYGVNVDLANRQMGRFSSSTSSAGSGNLNVNSMDLLSDSDIPVTPVEFANGEFKNNVRSNVTTVEGKVFSYGVGYDKDSGDFIFTRGQGGVGGFTPATASQTVTNQVGAYSTLSNTMNYSFMHSNMFMDLPRSMRLAAITTNRYASLNSEGMEFDNVNRAVWVKPYTSFEKVPLHNGPTVENISYGTLVGGDSDFINLKHGWTGVISPFIGYNGAHQNYSNISSYQNGGTLGVTGYLYKGNFFSANTLVAGASAGESNSRYGKDDYTMLSAGFATRNGYNFEFKEGKYILQPSVTMGYMYNHTFDYTSANGAKITDANLHVLQLNPTLKFIVNLHNKWQPYMQVGMVYNLMNECGVKANNVSLPTMTERSYVEYGVGLQRHIKDRFTGYMQAMIHNGGRNGISLTGGLKWSLGKDETKAKEKVKKPTSEKTALRIQLPAKETATTVPVPQRKIIKQLTDSQRALLGAKAQNTTMTSNKGYFQEL